jgi:uncharacterized protein YggE
MRLNALLVLAVMSPAALSLPAQQPPQPGPPQVVSSGEGEAQVVPDRARIHLAVETRGATAAAAANENARIQRAVIERIRALGIPAERISTVGYSVHPEYIYDREGRNAPRVSGYVARNTVRADIWSVAQVATVIDAALAAGANSIGALDFYSSTENDVRRTALQNAVRRARADAEAMAAAAGGRLGGLIELTSGGFFSPPPPRPMMEMRAQGAAQAADTPIEPGEQTIRANVTARWHFIQQGQGNAPPPL